MKLHSSTKYQKQQSVGSLCSSIDIINRGNGDHPDWRKRGKGQQKTIIQHKLSTHCTERKSVLDDYVDAFGESNSAFGMPSRLLVDICT